MISMMGTLSVYAVISSRATCHEANTMTRAWQDYRNTPMLPLHFHVSNCMPSDGMCHVITEHVHLPWMHARHTSTCGWVSVIGVGHHDTSTGVSCLSVTAHTQYAVLWVSAPAHQHPHGRTDDASIDTRCGAAEVELLIIG